MSGCDAPPSMGTLLALAEAVLLVVAAQALGYMAKTFNFFPAAAEAGMGAFVGKVAFPALLFHAIATIDLGTIKSAWALVVAVLLGKAVVWVLGYWLGRLLTSAEEGPGAGKLRGALYALFVTMSDDVGIGYPIFSVLFPPALYKLLFLLSALQSLVVNPVAFVFLGIGVAKIKAAEAAAADESAAADICTRTVVLRVLRDLRKNLLVVSVALGLVVNLATGATLPPIVEKFALMLGAAFQPLVLVMGGMASVGSFRALSSLRAVAVPLALVVLKSLVLPILIRGLNHLFNAADCSQDGDDNFAFEYGVLPTATSALVIARVYGVEGEMMSTFAASLALGKVVSFLLLFVFAGFMMSDMMELLEVIGYFSWTMNSLSAAGTFLVLAAAACLKAWRRPPLLTVLLYTLLQFCFHTIFLAVGENAILNHVGTPLFALQFGALNFFRWACDGYIAVVAVDHARRAFGRRSARLSRLSTGERLSLPEAATADDVATPPLPLRLHLGAAVALGLCATVPFVACCPVAPSYHDYDFNGSDVHGDAGSGLPSPTASVDMLPTWLPYGYYQEFSSATLYALLAFVIAASVGATVHAARVRAPELVSSGALRPARRGEERRVSEIEVVDSGGAFLGAAGQRSDAEPEAGAPASAPAAAPAAASRKRRGSVLAFTKRPGYKLRVGVLCVVAAARCLASAAMCAILAGSGGLSASAAQLLLVLVFFEDGQGIITFFLFGLQPEVLDSLGTFWRGVQARFAEVRWWRWVLCLGDGRDAAVSDATKMTRNALDGVSSLRMSAGGVPGSE